MRYVVNGTNAAGENQQVIINADNESDALSMAGQRGLTNPSVKLSPEHNAAQGNEHAIRASQSARAGGNSGGGGGKKKSGIGSLIKLAVVLVALAILVVLGIKFGIVPMPGGE